MKDRKLTAPLLFLLAVLVCALAANVAGFAPEERSEEIAANLAAGRVVIYVARDGIAIGVLENLAEPGSRLPAIVPVGSERVAILLGAVDWVLPASGVEAARLDRLLPRLLGGAVRATPRLGVSQASDIEEAGLALLEPLRAVAESLHGKLDLAPDEPVVELLLVDYAAGYGPEVWKLQYRLEQEPLRGDFWQTRILRPSHTQLYPPERGQPRTLIEVRYPVEDTSASLLDLLQRRDERLARIASADERMAGAADHVRRGSSQKAPTADAAAFLRAALASIAPKGADQAVGVLGEQQGFKWILEPPKAEQEPGGGEEPSENRPPGAPTLRKKPPGPPE